MRTTRTRPRSWPLRMLVATRSGTASAAAARGLGARRGLPFLEADDRLRTSTVEEREVLFGETADGLAIPVEHDHVDGDGFGLGRERRLRTPGLSGERRRRGHGEHPRQARRGPRVGRRPAWSPTFSSSGSREGPWPRRGSARWRGRGSRISRNRRRPSGCRWRSRRGCPGRSSARRSRDRAPPP